MGSVLYDIDESITQDRPKFPYVYSTKVFRCASDRSSFFNQGQDRHRIRSYSQTGFIGYQGGYTAANSPPFKNAIKMSDITAPGPSAVYVFIDEHENSINDSHFLPFSNLKSFSNQPWLDTPSGRHGNSTGFAFADGHAEIHRWQDSNVEKISYGANDSAVWKPGIVGNPGSRDFEWFTNHIAPFK